MNEKKSRISRNCKKCVICGVRRFRNSNVHLSQFPLDPVQCRLWVKASGVEDLVHLPIEKLHQLKFVCGSHFTRNSFNESRTRLRKHAVPLLNLPTPLPDELFAEFPLHMKGTSLHRFPDAKKFPDRLQAWVKLVGGKVESALDIQFYKKKMVCDRHFTEADRDRHSRLNALAVPSLHLFEAVLHAFPNPATEPYKFRVWVTNAGLLGGDESYIFKNRKICRIHFEETYHYPKNRLSKLAIPTLHLTGFKNEKNKDAPPCKKLKPEPPPERQPKSVDTIVPEVQSGKVEENVVDAELRAPSPLSDIPDPEPEPGPFSWQKSLPICIERDDILSDIFESDKEVPVVNLDEEIKLNNLNEVTEVPSKCKPSNIFDLFSQYLPLSSYNEPFPPFDVVSSNRGGIKSGEEDEEKKYVSEKHAEFSCDHCFGEIIGFRYTCVQCENFDLCRACESQLVHPHHYMLRVPRPRPFNEIRSVVAAIRFKLKVLEESFKQNSDDWAEVVIKKEEDPLEVEVTESQPTTTEQPLEECVVPEADITHSQQAVEQDSMSPSKDDKNKTSHHSPSTSEADSSTQKSKDVSKNRVILSGILDKDVFVVKKDIVSNSNLIYTKRKDSVSSIDVKHNTAISNRDLRLDKECKVVLNKNVKLVEQNISTNNTAVSNRDLSLDKECKVVLNKNVRLVKENAHTNLIILQQNQVIPQTDIIKYQLSKDRFSNVKKTSLQDTSLKTDIHLQQTDSKTNVKQTKDANPNEMFEEYLDEIWLDESILAEENSDKDKITETEQRQYILADENSLIDKCKESEEKEETSPKEKALETKEDINKHIRERTTQSKILNYKIKEAIQSQDDVIQPSNMLAVAETDDVTVVRMNVNQSNVEKPYNYYYYKLLPKRDKHK